MPVLVDNRQRKVRLSSAHVRRVAERALAALGREAGTVEITVVDDAEIRRLNGRFRGVHRRTDVLAFPLETPEAAAGLVGQIVLSAEAAARQAARLDVSRAQELALLVTHGVLHLVGYDDRDPAEAGLMHRRERAILCRRRTPPPRRLWTGLLPESRASGTGHPRAPMRPQPRPSPGRPPEVHAGRAASLQ
jgi:probable rRNA maturation factor